jgi:DnaJ-like protein/Regulator of Chromosome Condensation (RCC1) repeat protein
MPRRRISDLEGRDAYELLGISSTATAQEIRRGYRRAMFAAHPDRGGAEHLAKLINAAHELLLDDRASYDRHRRQTAREAAARDAAARETGRDQPATEQPATEQPGTKADWAEWEAETAETPDPWADADTGVGTPGRGADAPGRATQPEPPRAWQNDAQDDDRPFRPFAAGAPSGSHDLSWGDRLLNAPMMLGAMLLVGVVIGVMVAITGSSEPSTGIISSASVPSSTYPSYRTYSSYPSYPTYPMVTPSLPPLPSLMPTAPLSSAFTDELLGKPDHVCGVSKAQKLWCSGANDHGQLGVGDTDQHARAVTPVSRERWRSVTAGQSHTCAITTEQELYCWGENDLGQLGTSDHREISVPVQISVRSWRSVAASHDVTCGVRTDRRLYCWGTPFLRVKGGDQPRSSSTPKLYSTASTWTSVRADGTRLCATRPGHARTCFSS